MHQLPDPLTIHIMKQLQNNFTTPEQSKRLLELLYREARRNAHRQSDPEGKAERRQQKLFLRERNNRRGYDVPHCNGCVKQVRESWKEPVCKYDGGMAKGLCHNGKYERNIVYYL